MHNSKRVTRDAERAEAWRLGMREETCVTHIREDPIEKCGRRRKCCNGECINYKRRQTSLVTGASGGKIMMAN